MQEGSEMQEGTEMSMKLESTLTSGELMKLESSLKDMMLAQGFVRGRV